MMMTTMIMIVIVHLAHIAGEQAEREGDECDDGAGHQGGGEEGEKGVKGLEREGGKGFGEEWEDDPERRGRPTSQDTKPCLTIHPWLVDHLCTREKEYLL